MQKGLLFGVLCLCLVFTTVVSQDVETFDVEEINDNSSASELPPSGTPTRANPFQGAQCSICNDSPATTCMVKETTSDDLKTVSTVVKCFDHKQNMLSEKSSSKDNEFPGVSYSRTHVQSSISYN